VIITRRRHAPGPKSCRSIIDGPGQFIQTNVIAPIIYCNRVKHYAVGRRKRPRFFVFCTSTRRGPTHPRADGFGQPKRPPTTRTPYSSSKGADHPRPRVGHILRSPARDQTAATLRAISIPEKLYPRRDFENLPGEPIPVYGRAENIRDGSTYGSLCARRRRSNRDSWKTRTTSRNN